jgi:hypothetical protein
MTEGPDYAHLGLIAGILARSPEADDEQRERFQALSAELLDRDEMDHEIRRDPVRFFAKRFDVSALKHAEIQTRQEPWHDRYWIVLDWFVRGHKRPRPRDPEPVFRDSLRCYAIETEWVPDQHLHISYGVDPRHLLKAREADDIASIVRSQFGLDLDCELKTAGSTEKIRLKSAKEVWTDIKRERGL